MALPVSFYSIQVADNTLKPSGQPETSLFKVPIITLTPANVAATATLAGNLSAALAGIVLGNFLKNELVYDRSVVGVGPAASILAQRENKWLLRYHDTTTNQKFIVSIGTADLTVLPANGEFIDLTGVDGAAVKTAFEAVVRSPDNGANAVVLDSIQFVGRNT